MANDFDQDDFAPRSSNSPGGFDAFRGHIATVIVGSIVTFCCCACVGIILGGVGLGVCKTAQAKTNSTILLVVGLAAIVINLVLRFALNINMLDKMK